MVDDVQFVPARQVIPLSDEIRQPLIRLCGGDRAPRSAFREFSTALRTLSLAGTPAEEKLVNVEVALAASAKLHQVRSEPARRLLRHELLQIAAARDASPIVWEQLAEAALAAHGLQLQPQWEIAPLNLPEVVELEESKKLRGVSKRGIEIPSEVSASWRAASLAGAIDEPDAAVGLSFDECIAALRCHVLLMAHGTDTELTTIEQRLGHFLGQGLDRWSQILRKVLSLHEGSAQALEETWGAPLQRWVLLRLQHQVATRFGAPLPGYLDSIQQSRSGVHLAGQGVLQVIHGPIPPSASKEDAAGLAELEPLTKNIPIRAMLSLPEVEEAVHALHSEFPWAEQAVDQIGKLLRVRSLFGSPDLALPPILLIGPPGCGKSRLARRVAELLNLPFHPVAIGGTTDAKSLIGTARGWGGACASPLLIPLLANKTASALVLLDEIDKAGRNGDVQPNVTSALLGFLEPETASRHHDPFLQTTCDFSRLLFVATANSLKMPKALLSRFQMLYVPEPRKQDLVAIAKGALIDMARDLGIPAEFMPEPPAELIEDVGGNARDLRAALLGFLHEWACTHLHPARLN